MQIFLHFFAETGKFLRLRGNSFFASFSGLEWAQNWGDNGAVTYVCQHGGRRAFIKWSNEFVCVPASRSINPYLQDVKDVLPFAVAKSVTILLQTFFLLHTYIAGLKVSNNIPCMDTSQPPSIPEILIFVNKTA